MFGLAWMLGSAALGLLYDRSIGALVILSCGLQVAAIPFLVSARTELVRLSVPRAGTVAPK